MDLASDILQPFREHSAQLDERLASLFGGRTLPRPGRADCINEYGSLMADEGEGLPQKWSRASRMLPTGMLLESVALDAPRPRAHRASSEPPVVSPGDDEKANVVRAPTSHERVAGISNDNKASEPGSVPRMKIRLGGKIVATTGRPMTSGTGRPPKGAREILAAVDRLGEVPRLVSPIPPAWTTKLARSGLTTGSVSSAMPLPPRMPTSQAPLSGSKKRPRGTDEGVSSLLPAHAPVRRAASAEPQERGNTAVDSVQAHPRAATAMGQIRSALHPSATSSSHDDALGTLAGAFPAALRAATRGDSLDESSAALQEQGRKMKRLAEKKMVVVGGEAGGKKGGEASSTPLPSRPRPTHVSAYFLAQAGLKFLASAVVLEREEEESTKKGKSSGASTLYRQTAALLDAAARSADAAVSGPELVKIATAVLCERLAAVARLRAAYLSRARVCAAAQGFSSALEQGLGETFARGSPTDSAASTSTTVTGAQGKVSGGSPPGTATSSNAATTMVPMPRSALEAQRDANRETQECVFVALRSLSRSSDRLRDLVELAERESSLPALKAATAIALVTCDAGVGNPASLLGFARAGLSDILKII